MGQSVAAERMHRELRRLICAHAATSYHRRSKVCSRSSMMTSTAMGFRQRRTSVGGGWQQHTILMLRCKNRKKGNSRELGGCRLKCRRQRRSYAHSIRVAGEVWCQEKKRNTLAREKLLQELRRVTVVLTGGV